jgi:hypothetical protein
MKTKLFSTLAVAVTAVSLIVACNKSNSNGGGSGPTSSGTSVAQVQTQADDETQVSNEMDAATDDVNNTLNSQSAVSGSSSTYNYGTGTTITDGGGGGSVFIDYGICDATVTIDTVGSNRVITITYNGSNCRGNRIRTGVIQISVPLGVRWRDAGAVVTVSIENLKITRVRDGKSITLNGTYVYTNVSGGLLKDLATLGTITHTIAADSVTIEFADSATRTWSVAKQRVFTYNDGVVITTTGTHSDGTYNDISIWGTNRFGNPFTTLISEPKVIAQSCDYRLTGGQNTLIRKEFTATITYGLDVNGNPTSCPGTGTYYYKIVWTINGKTYTYIAPY